MSERLISIHRPSGKLLPLYAAASDRVKIKLRPKPTAESPLIVSVSELSDFLRCRVRWHWRYQCGLERKVGSDLRSIGILVHEILEAWYALKPAKRNHAAMKRVAKKLVDNTTLDELTTKDMALIVAMCVGYAKWVATDDKVGDAAIGLAESFPEEWFELPLTEDKSILLRGKIDNRFISTVKKKTMGCQETKTKSQIQIDVVDLNTQLSAYLWAMMTKYPGMKRYQAWYTILRRQMPTERVRTALFHRELVERDEDEIRMWVADTQRKAKDMLDAAIYPNETSSCGWDCDFKNPCMLRSTPADLKHVLKTEFRSRYK